MSEKITFKELIDEIATSTNQSQSFSASFVNELVNVIEAGLRETGSVRISGFGKFELRWMNERTGRNPQTGEEIIIPAQNKIVLKPYKKLSEHVNLPYESEKPKILEDSDEPSAAAETSETSRDEKQKPVSLSLIDSIEVSEADETGNNNDLLIERPHPEDQSRKQELDDFVISDSPSFPETTRAEKTVRKRFYTDKYTYLYTIFLFIIIIIAIYYFSTRSAREEISVIQPETEPAPIEEVQPPRDAEEDPEAATADTEEEQDIPESVTVDPGETLWTIAQSELGDPYLWPLIYDLNKNKMENPNMIRAGTSLTLPGINDPENLTDQQLRSVAQGYISVYQWIRSEKPDEAKFFLWAAGTFSMEVVLESANEVDPVDLEFAQRR